MTVGILRRAGICAIVLSAVTAAAASAQSAPHGSHATVPASETAAPPPAQHEQDEPAPTAPSVALPPFIPRLTEEDRRAAFPDVAGHAVHDRAVHSFVRFDHLEWQANGGGRSVALDSSGWIGGDRDRLWFRAEGSSDGGGVEEAEVHAVYGRQISTWWDLVAGLRQDFQPGPAQTWAAVGIQGLAPYWFHVEATGYVGAGGRTQARLETEYELLLTNRLVVQPRAELELSGKSDSERGIGAGITTTAVGLRLRYEFRPELAPYIGIVWRHKWGQTADFAEAAGDDGGARFVSGLRFWF